MLRVSVLNLLAISDSKCSNFVLGCVWTQINDFALFNIAINTAISSYNSVSETSILKRPEAGINALY